jgi:tetratricopeptide (TPR) repeat protein
MWEEVVAARTRWHGSGDQLTIIAQGGLAAAYLDQGRFSDALPLILEMLSFTSRFEGGQTNLQAVNLFQQGVWAAQRGDPGRAQQFFEASLDRARHQLGNDHYYLALILHELAVVLRQQDKTREAEMRLSECLRVIRSSVGLAHPRAAVPVKIYADLLEQQNRIREAKAILAEALAANEERFGLNNRWRFFYLAPSVALEARSGKSAEVSAKAREVLRLLSDTRGKEAQKIVDLGEIGWELFRHQVDAGLAEECFGQANQLWREQSDLDGYDLLRQLGDMEFSQGHRAEAACFYHRGLQLERSEGGVIGLLSDLVGPVVEEKRWAEAMAILRRGALRRGTAGTVVYDNPLRYLALVQLAAGQGEEARRTINTHSNHFRAHLRPLPRLLALRGMLVVCPDHPRLIETGPCLLAELEGLEKQLPGHPAVAEVTALALLRLNRPAELETLLERL